MNVGDVLKRSASNFPDKSALIFDDQRIDYRNLNIRVNCLSNSLLNMGLKKGDRIAVLLHNCPEFIEIYFACAKSGGIIVPINNLLRIRELKEILEYIEPRFLIFDKEFDQIVHTSSAGIKSIDFLITLQEESEVFQKYNDLVINGDDEEPKVKVSDDDIGGIFLTSGTTVKPKGAMRTHRHDVLNMMTSALELGIRHDDTALLLFPFYHITFADSLRHILMSNSVVLRKEGHFDPKRILSLLSRERVTTCQFVPTMINAMLELKDQTDFDLSHFRLLIYAASPMPVELLKKAMNRFKCQFCQLYGQSETGPSTTILGPDDHITAGAKNVIDRLASAGRAVVDYELRIVDEAGNDVATGQVGEIAVRSDAMTAGYWRLPEETAKAIRDGWLYTGDMGKFDDQRYVYIVDRKNDMIISGGKNIYPREIEEVLYTHEAVLEATVIGMPHDYWVETPVAFVVLKKGMKVSEEELIDLCKQSIASYKKPQYIKIVDQLPKSPTGKILKREIRDQYSKKNKARQ